MKIKLSNLEIDRMNILSSFIHFIPGNDNELNDFFTTNDIDIDFNVLNHKENKFQFKILLMIKINYNQKNKKPGYSIFTTMEGIFRVFNVKDDNDYSNLKLRSALPMLISDLRTHLFDLTSKFPEGGYLLPSIDLSYLIKQKTRIGITGKKNETKKN